MMGIRFTAWLKPWGSARHKSLFASFSSEKEDPVLLSYEKEPKRLLLPRFAAMGAMLLAAAPVKIWFMPKQDTIDRNAPHGERVRFDEHDFAALLRPDAAWQTAKRHIAVLHIGSHAIAHDPHLPAYKNFRNRR